MQGDVIIKDSKGNELWRGTATSFPLSIECESYIGPQNFIVRYSYAEDTFKKGFKDRNKIRGLVMMK